MKAAIIYGRKNIQIESLPKPNISSKEVLVRIKACGICPSDLRFYTGDKEVKKPWILGHEVSGIVEEVGDEVSIVKPGDRVVVCTDIPCGKCEYCIEGKTNFCLNKTITDGGFSEFKISHEDYLYKFSEEISFEEASFTEPLACCLNGILRANVTFGSKV
ncbi:MAG: alcohol dehydrogenase catalytic domain-containing protein, partial [Candidatus Bathyarchaeia archaeon]